MFADNETFGKVYRHFAVIRPIEKAIANWISMISDFWNIQEEILVMQYPQ